MCARMRPLTPERSAHHHLGALLRLHRCALGLSQEALGRRVLASGSLIRKIEHAQRRPHGDLIRLLDNVLRCDGNLVDAWHLATDPETRSAASASTSRYQGTTTSGPLHAPSTSSPEAVSAPRHRTRRPARRTPTAATWRLACAPAQSTISSAADHDVNDATEQEASQSRTVARSCASTSASAPPRARPARKSSILHREVVAAVRSWCVRGNHLLGRQDPLAAVPAVCADG